jgi:hypothetical protein
MRDAFMWIAAVVGAVYLARSLYALVVKTPARAPALG